MFNIVSGVAILASLIYVLIITQITGSLHKQLTRFFIAPIANEAPVVVLIAGHRFFNQASLLTFDIKRNHV
jgi:hypothetical protein